MINEVVGSQALPEPNRFRAAVESLIAQVDHARAAANQSLAGLLSCHNSYALYSALLSIHTTGHRPVRDPFAYRVSLGGNFAIAEDKAPTDQHAFRAVVLPPVTTSQLEHYEHHLWALRQRFVSYPNMQSLVGAIDHLFSPTTPPPLPWFFLLRETQSLSLSETELGSPIDRWHWPANVGRHMIATGLRKHGVQPELIALQMGHLSLDEAVCGPFSSWSLTAAQQILSPALQQVAESWGWRPIVGLEISDEKPRPPRRLAKPHYVHGPLGPELRRAERERSWKEDQDLVNEIIKSEMLNVGLNQASLDRIVERLQDLSESSPYRLGRRLGFLWRWALGQRSDSTQIRLPARLHCLLPLPAPFTRNFPNLVSSAEHLREAFIAYLTRAGRAERKLSGVQNLAEVIVSSALFGGLVQKDRLQALPELLRDHAFKVSGGLLLDVPEQAQELPWRWLPDDLTAALISRTTSKVRTDSKTLRHAVSQLLTELDPAIHAHDPYAYLSELASAYTRWRMPGFIAAAITGDIAQQPLPSTALIRLIRDVRLALPKPVAKEANEAETAASIRIGRQGPREVGLALNTAIRKLITELEHLEARGQNRSQQALKRRLHSGLGRIVREAEPSTPAIATLVAAWTMELASKGTRWKSRIAFGTVTEYFYTVSVPLIECASDTDFLNLSGSEFETIYLQVLNYREGKQRSYLAARLIEFHNFLVREWAVDSLDWGLLAAEAGLQNTITPVDANLLTPTEYRYALKLLQSDPGVDARTRLQCSALLVLGYRFGPRIGDLLRLRYDDLQIWDEGQRAVLQIETNIYGSPKSAAGVRQIPLLGAFTPEELKTLEKLLAHFDEFIRPQFPVAGLFVNPDDPRAPVERRFLLDRVHLAMRTASGDPSLHFHHLRHGFGTRLAACLWGDLAQSRPAKAVIRALSDGLPDGESVRRLLTGHEHASDGMMQVFPALLGHAQVGTSLHHYVHLIEFLAHGIVNAALPKLTAAAWSYALGEARGTVQQRLTRHPTSERGQTHIPVGPTWLNGVRALTVPIASGRPPKSLPDVVIQDEKITLEMIDRVLVSSALRSGATTGLAERLLISERSVYQIVETARLISGKLPSVRPSVVPPADWLFEALSTGPMDHRVLKENARVRRGLRSWQLRLDDLTRAQQDQLAAAVQIWQSSLDAHQNTIRVQQHSTLKHLLEGLALLGLSSQTIRAEIDTPGEDAELDPLKDALETLNLSQIRVRHHRRHRGVTVRFKRGTTAFGYPASLYRGLYVLSVCLAAGLKTRKDDLKLLD